MEMIPLALIGIVLIAGVITLAMGSRGWSLGTTIGAWLVLVGSVTFLLLAGIRGQSERAWAALARGWEARVLEVRDAVRVDPQGRTNGMTPLGECSVDSLQNCSLAALETKQEEWRRALDRVNLWRGRFWSKATFTPPEEGRPGKITLEAPENPAIAQGAEVFAFDVKPAADGGRFVGGFRVVKVEQNVLEIEPLGRVDDRDKAVWKEPRDEVTVYENLPFDRWVAFHRTGKDAAATVIPEPTKRLPEEGQPLRTALEKHSFPEDLIAAASEEGGENPFPEDPDMAPAGVDWASLEIEQDFDWTTEGGDGGPPGSIAIHFRAGERVSAFPARDVAALRKAGASFKHAWSIPPGLYWAEVEFDEAVTFERGEKDPLEFAAGDRARLPLADAEKLAAEKKLTIKRRLHRRPLADPSTALLGLTAVDRSGQRAEPRGSDEAPADPGAAPVAGGATVSVDASGIYRLRGTIEQRIGELRDNAKQMTNADDAAKRQFAELEKLRSALEKDLGGWTDDASAAEKLAATAEQRLEQARSALEKSEKEVVELGARLRRLTTTLTTEIDRRTVP